MVKPISYFRSIISMTPFFSLQTIFLTKDDGKPEKSQVDFLAPAEGEPQGLIREDGEINWACPCLGGMPVGPCGMEFRTAFECFHKR